MHTRGSQKVHEEKQRKSLLVSELLPKAGCSFGILLFFVVFLHEPLLFNVYYCMECRSHTKTSALFSKITCIIKFFRENFASCVIKFFREHHHTHERCMKKKEQKTQKFQMSNQHLGVNQRLRVTPNRRPKIFFLRFSS